MTKESGGARQPVNQELGSYLANLRLAKRLTLREVQEASGNQVSNAYLSQLEHGYISKPSPNVLYQLASVYGVSYEGLMVKAGYLVSSEAEQSRHGRAATIANEPLTPDEEGRLLEYLAFLRSQNRAKK